MKNVSKLALFVAAGMLSAGANANTIVLGEEGTSLSISGSAETHYISNQAVDSSSTNASNHDDLNGEVGLDVTAERSFGNFDGYAEIEFTFKNQESAGSSIDSGSSVIGFTGDFGQIEVGDTDSVYEDDITDAINIGEKAEVDVSESGQEDSVISYYSPSTNGLSFNVQASIEDEQEGDNGTTDTSLNALGTYDFGAGAIHVGYNEADFTGNSDVVGIAAVFGIGVAEVALVHEMESIDDVDTDRTGLAVTAGFGPGDVYAAFQSVSPEADDGNDLSQYVIGINGEIADGLSSYAEYGNLDGQGADELDTVIAVGFAYDF
jgi:hypothetical protein